jgi:hypothetical protein
VTPQLAHTLILVRLALGMSGDRVFCGSAPGEGLSFCPSLSSTSLRSFFIAQAMRVR